MALTTLIGHVSRALDFQAKDDIYFSIGKTTQWPNESEPPVEDNTVTDLEETVGYKKVTGVKYLVVPDAEAGTITYRGEKWRIVDPAFAREEGARWVYISATLQSDELPLVQFRQVGVHTRLQTKGGVPENKLNLLPSEVEDTGILEVIENRRVTHRQKDQQEQLSLIIEF